jgi:hypothetical protein
MIPPIPPDVARQVISDMRAFYREKNSIKRDGIAAATLERLRFLIQNLFERWCQRQSSNHFGMKSKVPPSALILLRGGGSNFQVGKTASDDKFCK